jgi:hypothetical protein
LDNALREETQILDRDAFGVDRSKLIEMLVDDCHVTPLLDRDGEGRLTGYGLARPGTAAVYVGPVIAKGREASMTLLDGLLSQVPGQRAYLDLNTAFGGGWEILTARGFTKQRDLIRMSYGKESKAGSSPTIFAIAGPEVG